MDKSFERITFPVKGAESTRDYRMVNEHEHKKILIIHENSIGIVIKDEDPNNYFHVKWSDGEVSPSRLFHDLLLSYKLCIIYKL